MEQLELDKAKWVVFDVETTGLDPRQGDKICEIAAIKLIENRKVDQFHSLVNPERPISSGAYRVNQITDEMVKDAPTITVILPQFLSFIEGSVLVAYNIGFDLGFIGRETEEKGETLPPVLVDVLTLARKLMPQIGRFPLGHVAESLGISFPQRHRALADVEVTAKIFGHFLSILKANGAKKVGEVSEASRPGSHFIKEINHQKILAIEEALEGGKKVKIRYHSTWTSLITEREITPKAIQREYDKTYIVAHCYLRNEERSFRLDSILEVQRT